MVKKKNNEIIKLIFEAKTYTKIFRFNSNMELETYISYA